MSDTIKYDQDNRISYDEESDSLYIWKAEPQGRVGCVMLYANHRDNSMVTLDTDEVGTIVGVEIVNLSKITEKFNLANRE